MRTTLRLYTGNRRLYIYNNPANLAAQNFHSQYGQDLFVYERLFQGQRSGFFVDVGANHPIECSNTYLLERNGWTGLAFEPQDYLRELWPSLRTTPCLGMVIGPENKEVMFVQARPDEHGLSGVDGYNKVAQGGTRVRVPQRRLADVLAERSIGRVDYLSIDVEGYEMNVLDSIDFAAVDIRVIGIENDLGFAGYGALGKRLGKELGNNRLREFLKSRGYSHVARIVCDDFFVKAA
jgi:FkbM family methyltransferase